MAKVNDNFRLGAAVIVILVLFFASLMFIGGSELFGAARTTYAVRFPVSSPLPDEIKAGAPVFCGLLKVGAVTRVAHDRTEGKEPGGDHLLVRLDFSVDGNIPLRSDCRITVRGPLLGGGGKLVIADPGDEGRLLEPGAVVDGLPGSTFDAALESLSGEIDPQNPGGLVALVKTELDAGNARSLMGKIHRSIDDMNTITAGIGRQVDPREKEALIAKLNMVLDNVNVATGHLREQVTPGADGALLSKLHAGLDAMNAGLFNLVDMIETNRDNIDETIAGVRRTVDTLDRRIATPLGDQLDTASDTSLLSKLHVSFDRLNQSLGDINVVSGATRQVMVLNKDRLDDIFANVGETSAHLKAASKEIRYSPWRLLYRPSLEETRELNLFDASREFAEAATHLEDSATQLRALLDARGGALPADDPDLQRIRARLQETFEKYTIAEETLWKRLSGG